MRASRFALGLAGASIFVAMTPSLGTSVRRAGLVNSSFSLLNSITNVFLVPFLLSIYGLRTYGALSLLTALAQYFGLLDFGFSNALVRYRVKVGTHGDFTYFHFRRRIIGLFTLIGSGVVLMGSATAGSWGPVLNLTHVSRLWLAALAAGTLTILALVGNCYNSTLVANLRFTHLNIFNYVRNIGPQVVAALVYLPTRDLATALSSSALFAFALLIAQVGILRRLEPDAPRTISTEQHAGFRRFLHESVGFSAQSLFTALVVPLLQVVVGWKFGSEANGLLDIARRLLFAFRRVIEAAFVPLFARANQLIEGGQLKQLHRIAIRSTLLSVGVALVYFVALRISLPWILSIWISGTADLVEPIALTFLYGVTFTIPHIAIYQLLSTAGRGRLVNAMASALSSAVLLVALAPAVQTISQVLALYAIGASLAAMLTLGYGARYIARLRFQWQNSDTSAQPEQPQERTAGGSGSAPSRP